MRNTIERTVLAVMLILALTASGRAGDTPEPQTRAVNHYITKGAYHDEQAAVYRDAGEVRGARGLSFCLRSTKEYFNSRVSPHASKEGCGGESLYGGISGDDGIPLPEELIAVLVASCEAEGVPQDIALGVMDVETGGTFDPTAVNPVSGCYGLMQLNPVYFPSGLSPAENIQAGIGYLGELLARYGATDAALTAYHDGHDTGRRGYALAVLEAAEKWR